MLKNGSIVYVGFLKDIQPKTTEKGDVEYSRKGQMSITHKQGDIKTFENFDTVFKGTQEQLKVLQDRLAIDIGSFAVSNWQFKDDKGNARKGYTFYVNDFKPHLWEKSKDKPISKSQDVNKDPFVQEEIGSDSLPF